MSDLHQRAWLRRRHRVRRLLKPLPRRSNLSRYPVIRRFERWARAAPWLWSFHGGAVVRALYIGCVLAFMPTYGLQVLLAVLAALLLRSNLTLTVALQFITNPLTVAPAYWLTDRIGMALMGHTALTGIGGVLLVHTRALFIGALLLGLACGALLHGAWLLLSWEARRFRARRETARLHSGPTG